MWRRKKGPLIPPFHSPLEKGAIYAAINSNAMQLLYCAEWPARKFRLPLCAVLFVNVCLNSGGEVCFIVGQRVQ